MAKLYDTLRADIITAVKARDADRALILRTIDGAIQRAAIDQNLAIDDALVVTTLRKAVKDLKGSREQFAQGGREDLVAKNDAERALLETYLPAQIDVDQLDAIVTEAIAAAGATEKRDMGKVMGALKQRPDAGQIDFGAASKLIQARLA